MRSLARVTPEVVIDFVDPVSLDSDRHRLDFEQIGRFDRQCAALSAQPFDQIGNVHPAHGSAA